MRTDEENVRRIQISISKSASDKASAHGELQAQDYASLDDIVNPIQNHVWSPIAFKNGVRKESHFLHSDLVALDFDDGKMSMRRARNICHDNKLASLIATTKSHQIEKDGHPACDRFRLILQWATRCDNLAAYKYSVRLLIKLFGCDRACSDGARFFYPCVKIMYLRPRGRLLEWQTPPPPTPVAQASVRRKCGVLAPWLQRELEQPIGAGNRNRKIYFLAAKLTEAGLSEAEVKDTLSRVSVDMNGFSVGEFERARRQGIKDARR